MLLLTRSMNYQHRYIVRTITWCLQLGQCCCYSKDVTGYTSDKKFFGPGVRKNVFLSQTFIPQLRQHSRFGKRCWGLFSWGWNKRSCKLYVVRSWNTSGVILQNTHTSVLRAQGEWCLFPGPRPVSSIKKNLIFEHLHADLSTSCYWRER